MIQTKLHARTVAEQLGNGLVGVTRADLRLEAGDVDARMVRERRWRRRTLCSSGARPRVFLSGLPGVTSHQTRSRSSRFIAIRQAPRWAWCGGSNVPPNRPMLMPGAWGGERDAGRGITRPDTGSIAVAEPRAVRRSAGCPDMLRRPLGRDAQMLTAGSAPSRARGI